MKRVASLDESTEALFLASRVLGEAGGTVVVTSCEDGAGKTTFCKLLATVAVERLSRRVVFVDLNLRHPSSEEFFVQERWGGRLEFRRPGPDYAELPGWAKRERIAGLLERPNEDTLLIVDTSPLGIFNRNNVHPVHLAEWIRDFVLVVAQESSRHSAIRQAKVLLETHGIRILGAVLNQHGSDEAPDAASVTGWRTFYRTLARMVRRWPEISKRMKGSIHAVRVMWRLFRPGLRRAFEAAVDWPPVRWGVWRLRRSRPALAHWLRGLLSGWRAKIDRWLQRGDRRWTRS